MIYKNLSAVNGVLLAVMIFLNALLASQIGPFMGSLVFYLVGLIFILMISVSTGNRLSSFTALPWLFFLPGILGVMTTVINNVAMPKLGVMLVSGLALFGQLVMSAAVDHFGWFGMSKIPIKPQKILGFTLISLGIVSMIML